MQIVSTGEGGREWSGGEGDPCYHQGFEGGFRSRYVVCTLFVLQIWRFKGARVTRLKDYGHRMCGHVIPNSDMLSFELFRMCLKRFYVDLLPGLCARSREDVE